MKTALEIKIRRLRSFVNVLSFQGSSDDKWKVFPKVFSAEWIQIWLFMRIKLLLCSWPYNYRWNRLWIHQLLPLYDLTSTVYSRRRLKCLAWFHVAGRNKLKSVLTITTWMNLSAILTSFYSQQPWPHKQSYFSVPPSHLADVERTQLAGTIANINSRHVLIPANWCKHAGERKGEKRYKNKQKRWKDDRVLLLALLTFTPSFS